MAKTGRPSKASDASLKEAVRLASEGITDDQIAKALKVTRQTVCNWKHKHPEFFDALKKSKAIADEDVERSLFERARGYSHPAIKIFLDKNGKPVKVPYTEHFPPDTTACIFWLKNRQPERWRDKQEVEHSLGASAERLVTRLTAALSRVHGEGG